MLPADLVAVVLRSSFGFSKIEVAGEFHPLRERQKAGIHSVACKCGRWVLRKEEGSQTELVRTLGRLLASGVCIFRCARQPKTSSNRKLSFLWYNRSQQLS